MLDMDTPLQDRIDSLARKANPQPSTEERIAALEAQSAEQTKVISELLSGLISANQRLEALEAQLAQIKTGLQEGLLSVCHRLEALEAKPKGRGSRLSEDWMPNPAERDFSVKIGLTGDDIVKAILSFKAYWVDKTGPNSTKLSWSRTWQEWCRKDADRLGREPRTATLDTGSPDDSPVPVSEHTEAARQALADILISGDELDASRIRNAFVGPNDVERWDRNIVMASAITLEGARQARGTAWAKNWTDDETREFTKFERRAIMDAALHIGIQPHQFAWPEVK